MIVITENIINIQEYLNESNESSSGALLIFCGTTRDNNLGKSVDYLEYESYVDMAKLKLKEIADFSISKWDLNNLKIVHRIGKVEISEISLLIIASSPHRNESFRAIEYIVSELKKSVPIWKKEYYSDGENWIGSADNPN